MDALVPYSQKLIKPYDRDAFWSAMAGNKVDQIRTGVKLASLVNDVRKNGVYRRSKKSKYTRGSYQDENRSGRDATTSNGTRKAMVYTRTPANGLQKLIIAPIYYPTVSNITSDKTRLSNELFCPGIKICQTFYNDALFPIEIHWAMLRLKAKEYNNPLAVKAELLGDFFRNPIDTLDKETDFNETSGVYEQSQKCFPINTEKFDIMTHKKFMMGGKLSTISVMDSRHIRKIEKWFRINKRLQFEGAGQNEPSFPFTLVAWACPMDPNDYSAAATPWRWETWITPYFRSKT